MITQSKHKLNIKPYLNGKVVVHASQYDTQTSAVIFTLYDGDEYLTIPSGASIIVDGTKPDSHGFSYSARSFSSTEHTVLIDITEQMTVVAGDVVCELRIRNGSDTVGTANFILQVEPSALAKETTLSETDIPLIQRAVDIAANLDSYISQTKSAAEEATTAASNASSSASSAQTAAKNAESANQNVQQLYDSISSATAAANSAAENAQSVADTVQAKLDSGALKGDKGDKGDTGDAGVVTELSGYVLFQYDSSDGHLYCYSSADMSDRFQFDETDGHLYLLTPVDTTETATA